MRQDDHCARAPISVCMACYNGSTFLQPQIESILAQLLEHDEIVIVDDASVDDTVEQLTRLGDRRIIVHQNSSNRGHVQSFARALSLARHPIVFMADQDDIWLDGRVTRMINRLSQPGVSIVWSNTRFIDAQGHEIEFGVDGVLEHRSRSYARNILGIFAGETAYFGCASAFKRDLLCWTLPIPEYVESHDLWLAMAGNLIQENHHLESATLLRRVHGVNASIISRSLPRKVWSRFIFLRSLFDLRSRMAARVPSTCKG